MYTSALKNIRKQKRAVRPCQVVAKSRERGFRLAQHTIPSSYLAHDRLDNPCGGTVAHFSGPPRTKRSRPSADPPSRNNAPAKRPALRFLQVLCSFTLRVLRASASSTTCPKPHHSRISHIIVVNRELGPHSPIQGIPIDVDTRGIPGGAAAGPIEPLGNQRFQHPGSDGKRLGQPDCQFRPDAFLFQMGIPVSGKNMFPSNIAGLPTWFTIRASKYGYIGRRKEIDFLVAMNPETAREDVMKLDSGAAVVYDEPLKLNELRSDLHFYPVPFDKLVAPVCPEAKLRKLVRNMIYDGVVAQLLSIEMEEIQKALVKQFGKKKAKAAELNLGACKAGFDYAAKTFTKADRVPG